MFFLLLNTFINPCRAEVEIFFSYNKFASNYCAEFNKIFPVNSHKSVVNLDKLISKLLDARHQNYKWENCILSGLKQAEEWVMVNGTKEERLLIDFYLMMYYNSQLEDQMVIDQGRKVFSDNEFYEMPHSAHAIFALYASYGRLGNYKLQLKSINQLIYLNDKFDYPVRPKGYSYANDLGILYYNLMIYPLSRKQFIKQKEIFEKAGDTIRISSMNNNIGLTYYHQGQSDSAIAYFNKALHLMNEMKTFKDKYYSVDYNNNFRNVVNSNKARVLFDQGKIDNLDEYYKKEIVTSKVVKEPKTTTQSYLKLSEYYSNIGKGKLALAYADSTILFEQQFPNPLFKQEAKWYKAKALALNGEVIQSLKLFDASINLKDSIYKDRLMSNFSDAATEFDFLKTREELEKNQVLLAQEETLNALQKAILVIAFFILMIFAIAYAKSQKKKVIIENQKVELSKNLREKEVMLQEIHHRIKNNLQMISGILELQSSKLKSTTDMNVFKESRGYINSILLVHELLYKQNQLAKINLESYFYELVKLLTYNSQKKIDINIKVDSSISLNLTQVTPLGLITSELIINSLKHAFEARRDGIIDITLRKLKEKVYLVYQDNGPGFKFATDTSYYKTGFNLIFILSEDLDGTIKFPEGRGFHFTIHFDQNNEFKKDLYC